MSKRRLLVVDDEPDIAQYIGQVAEGLGYETRVTTDAENFKESYNGLNQMSSFWML